MKKKGLICFLNRFGLLFNTQEMWESVYARKMLYHRTWQVLCNFINSCYCRHPILLQAFFLLDKVTLAGVNCLRKAMNLIETTVSVAFVNSRGVTEGQFATLHFYQIYFF